MLSTKGQAITPFGEESKSLAARTLEPRALRHPGISTLQQSHRRAVVA
jgi:hypothetical protein